jgi:peptidyl-dipeptidase Dcp
VLLNEEDKEKLKKISMDLSLKSLQFGQNVLASTNNYFKHITHKEDLAGIPKPFLSNMPKKLKKEILKAG